MPVNSSTAARPIENALVRSAAAMTRLRRNRSPTAPPNSVSNSDGTVRQVSTMPSAPGECVMPSTVNAMATDVK